MADTETCPVARALAVIGERWTLLVVRDLLRHGPRRFQDLELSLDGVSPNTLSARLKRLEEAKVIERRFYEQHPPRAEYVLTEKGRALGPIVLAMKKWGEAYAPDKTPAASPTNASRRRARLVRTSESARTDRR